jgi:hypothetical protein
MAALASVSPDFFGPFGQGLHQKHGKASLQAAIA